MMHEKIHLLDRISNIRVSKIRCAKLWYEVGSRTGGPESALSLNLVSIGVAVGLQFPILAHSKNFCAYFCWVRSRYEGVRMIPMRKK